MKNKQYKISNDMTPKEESQFLIELIGLINKHSAENESNTPDYILGEYLRNCLRSFNLGIRMRDNWYGGKQSILDSERKEKWIETQTVK